MAYLVKGKTFESYWSIKWSKSKFSSFKAVYDTDDPDSAYKCALRDFQEEKNQVVVIDSVSEVIERDAAKAPSYDMDKLWYEQKLVAFDVETTGFCPINDRIVEIAFSRFDLKSKSFAEPVSFVLNEGIDIPLDSTAIHGISTDDVKGCPSFDDVLPTIIRDGHIDESTILIAHNRGFDVAFLSNAMTRHPEVQNVLYQPCWCSMELSTRTPVGQAKHRLGVIQEALGIAGENSHRAGDDAKLAGDVFMELARKNKFFWNATTRDVMEFFSNTEDMVPWVY